MCPTLKEANTDQLLMERSLSLSVQSVLGGSTLSAVTMVNVMTVTLVTVPVPVRQVSEAQPVSCAVRDSLEPPVKVSCWLSFLCGVFSLQVCSDDCSVFQPVTAQSMGHVMMDMKVQVHASVTSDGRDSGVTFSKVSSTTTQLTSKSQQLTC